MLEWNTNLSSIPEPDLYPNSLDESTRLNILAGTTQLAVANHVLKTNYNQKDLYPDKVMLLHQKFNPMLTDLNQNSDGLNIEKVFYENENYMDENRRLKKALDNFSAEVYIPEDKNTTYNSQLVGEEKYILSNNQYYDLFSKEHIHSLSKEITKQLTNLLKKKIVVTDRVIQGVLNNYYRGRRNKPVIIDYPHMTQGLPSAAQQQTDTIKALNTSTVSAIVQAVSDEHGILENNSKLDIWTTLYNGDPEKGGLLQHPKLRYRRNTKNYMNFNMNY